MDIPVNKVDTPRQQKNSLSLAQIEQIEQLRSENEALVHQIQELQQELSNTVAKPEPPDYQAMRDRILRSLVSGRGKVGTFSPQYRFASKALDKFIEELNK